MLPSHPTHCAPPVKYAEKDHLFFEPKITQSGSQFVMTNVAKQSKRKRITIDTKFRSTPLSSSSSQEPIVISLPEKIHDVKSLIVTDIQVPLVFNNISSKKGNHCFVLINKNAASTTIIIPSAHYKTLGDVITAINTACNNLVAFTYDTQNNRCEVKIMTNALAPFEIVFNVHENGQIDNQNIFKKLGYLLGFHKVRYTISSTTPIVAENSPLLSLNTKNLFLSLDDSSSGSNPNSFLFPKESSFVSNGSAIVAKMPLDSMRFAFGAMASFVIHINLMSEPKTFTGGRIHLQTFRVQLLDDDGDHVDLQGLDFSFSVLLEVDT